MRTFLDFVGLNPLRPLIAFGPNYGPPGTPSPPEDNFPNYGPPSVSSTLTVDELESLFRGGGGNDGGRSSTPKPAVDPVQTALESLAERQYLSYEPNTFDDFMEESVLDPFDAETVQQLADQYYDFGSEPMSVADQIAQYDSGIDLDALDADRELASSVADALRFSLADDAVTDDDMGLPDISVDEAMFSRGDLGRSGIGEVFASPDVDLSAIYGQYRKSPSEPEANFIRDMMRFAKDESGDYVVKPRLRDYLERTGLLVADLMLPDELLGLDISSLAPDTVNAALEAYKTGSLAYGPNGNIIGVRDSSGNLIRLRPDGPVDPFRDQGDRDDCPPGYVRNSVTGVCEPVEEDGGSPKITLPDIDRPDPSPIEPDFPILGPIEPGPGPILPPPSRKGMKIRVPRFAEGGPVTPHIDRFFSSLRG